MTSIYFVESLNSPQVLSEQDFDIQGLGDHQLKGPSKPLRLYLVVPISLQGCLEPSPTLHGQFTYGLRKFGWSGSRIPLSGRGQSHLFPTRVLLELRHYFYCPLVIYGDHYFDLQALDGPHITHTQPWRCAA